jgi:hypothetical protein
MVLDSRKRFCARGHLQKLLRVVDAGKRVTTRTLTV